MPDVFQNYQLTSCSRYRISTEYLPASESQEDWYDNLRSLASRFIRKWDQWSSSNHRNLFRVYFEAPTCQRNFTNFFSFLSFTRFVDTLTIQLSIRLLIQSGGHSSKNAFVLAFASLRRPRRTALSFVRAKTLFPQTSKRVQTATRSYLPSNRSKGARYRFQIFIASPSLPPRPRRIETRKWKRALLVAAAVCPRF